jgi:hypothetical protein
MQRQLAFLILFIVALVFAGSALTADPTDAKVSTYAPAKDLLAQVNVFIERIQEDLSDADAYGDEQKQRVVKDSNTLAVLGAALGMSDEEHEVRAGAPALVAAAKELAKNAGDHEQASAALAKAQQALTVTKGGGKIGWVNVADLGQLMKQVPIVNNSLRSGVTGSRFDRLKEKTAATAATLAAIAQVSAHDDSYAEDEEAFAKWKKISLKMRDAAAATAVATRAGDQAAAKKQLELVVKTCDDCHHIFREGK